ncbi:MAG: N-6 DNA methylase, partial [Anaerolineae bacterium]
MTPPVKVLELIERFERNLDAYKRPGYKEARVRVEFIDPFFEALGWDVHNRQGRGEHDKDVIYEDAIKVGGKTRAPDYSFRIGQERRFFLEAKKPAVSLMGDVGPAYQLRRYSWSVKLPLGILTDFEEFAVYDCRQRPRSTDKATVGRVMYVTFDQYRDRWDEIYDVFAKESVQRGSFDRYAQETKTKRGTSAVDAELLKEIEGWRDVLARNIALRNKALSVHELNFCVQRTIDRIVFLRMCEDRGIEEYGQLLALTNGPHIYPRLTEYYRRADEKYDAGLFDFRADTLTRTLMIDDQALKPILTSLYYPQCPYEFSVLPVEILGQVYEQFLGKVIRLTAGHRAKVEEKPEVKKAGGVYYTPSYIVDYIVRQTVGKLVAGQTPRQIARLRILDPACGSGSFLLGAYQYLLDYHRQWYENNDPARYARRKQPPVYHAPSPSQGEGRGGGWRLTGAEKKRILLNNIHGVDIDRQAVEVTKLSLLLKVLEGETEETLGQQLSLWRERALPDLGNNIKCGNSLIGPDYFAAQLMPGEEEMRRVNPFDWEAEFPEVMAAGGSLAGSGQGFDCVTGNPPYIRIQTMKEWAPTEVEFYKQRYAAASKGNYDIYVVFVERALQLLNEQGRMGYILPHKFFQAKYGQPLRQLLAGGKHLAEIVHFGDQQIFTGASTYTCLLFLDKKGNQQFRYA